MLLARAARARTSPAIRRGRGSPALAYDSRARRAGDAVLLRAAASRADGHDFAAGAVERRRRGAGRRAAARARRARRSLVADARAAMAPVAAALLRRPDRASCAWSGITGTNGKTTTAFLVRADARGGRASQCGLLGTVKQVVGGASEDGRAHDARGDRPAARPSRAMLEAGDGACAMEVSSHALALHRADAIHFDGRGLHQPDPGPPRLPRRHGGLLRRPSGGCSRRGPRRARSSTSTTPTARRLAERASRSAHHLLGRRAPTPTLRAATSSFDARGLALHCVDAGRRARGARRRCRATSTSPTRSARSRRRARSGVDAATIAARRWRGAERVPGPLRAGRRGPGLRRARRLRAHARLAGERAARGARG